MTSDSRCDTRLTFHRLLKVVVISLVLVVGLAGRRVAAATRLVMLRERNVAALRGLLARQQDPTSADFQRWLTPREFGRRFGARTRDVRKVSRWLAAEGCRVRRFPNRQLVACSGPPPREPPANLRWVIDGVLDVDRPPPTVNHLREHELRPLLRGPGGGFGFSPAEFARVYNLEPALAAGFDGRDQRIGIVAISGIHVEELAAFRERFGLPAAVLTQDDGPRLVGSTDPEIGEVEADLDVEWSGAVAPGARLHLAVADSPVESLAHLVNLADISVISASTDLCRFRPVRHEVREADRLLRQAKAQGQTVLAASGDRGSRSCGDRFIHTFGALASSPLVTSVGGTMPSPALDDADNATGYGTEVVWNDNDKEGTSSGGGLTRLRRPSYQRGLPHRTVPDVSFPASGVFPIATRGLGVVCCVGGTSVAAPAWAGVVAILNQMRGARIGFLNPRLYALGRAQRRGGPVVFHDVTEGANDRFPALPGYDLATGWGTIDGEAFFNALADVRKH